MPFPGAPSTSFINELLQKVIKLEKAVKALELEASHIRFSTTTVHIPAGWSGPTVKWTAFAKETLVVIISVYAEFSESINGVHTFGVLHPGEVQAFVNSTKEQNINIYAVLLGN